jgi:hypothetical protein
MTSVVALLAAATTTTSTSLPTHTVTVPSLGVLAGVTSNASEAVAFFGGECCVARHETVHVENTNHCPCTKACPRSGGVLD